MTCPDWPSLVRRRDRAPEAWDAGLEHLDDCPQCRDAALDAEPTLLFRRLPAPAPRRDEIATMKEAVAALCRNSRPRHSLGAQPSAWLRAAAVAAVLITGALLQGAVTTVPGANPGWIAPETAGLLAAREAADDALARMPLVEYVDPAYGSVVEVVDDQVSLVLVLPPDGRTPVNDV